MDGDDSGNGDASGNGDSGGGDGGGEGGSEEGREGGGCAAALNLPMALVLDSVRLKSPLVRGGSWSTDTLESVAPAALVISFSTMASEMRRWNTFRHAQKISPESKALLDDLAMSTPTCVP